MEAAGHATLTPMSNDVNPAARIAGALADPLRYAVVDRLVAGPATVSELVAVCGAAQSKLSNHLAVLREAKVVTARRTGRNVVYSLADPVIATVLEALANSAGDGPVKRRAFPEIAVARSCYDHVAGRLGVGLFRALVGRGALQDVAAVSHARKVRSGLGSVVLGPRAGEVFGALAIDLDEVGAARRQFATACNDWTESQPHLGGALGAALQNHLLRERWVLRRSGTRALRVTETGRRALRARLGIELED